MRPSGGGADADGRFGPRAASPSHSVPQGAVVGRLGAVGVPGTRELPRRAGLRHPAEATAAAHAPLPEPQRGAGVARQGRALRRRHRHEGWLPGRQVCI